MKKKMLCLIAACTTLATACGSASSEDSSVASAAVEQTADAETQSSQTEAAPSSDVIYLKETVTTYDKDGNLVRTTTYTYNDHNDVAEYVNTFPDDDPARFYYEYDYRDDGTISSCRKYDSRNLMREETFYKEDGETVDYIVKNTYSNEHEEEDSSKEDEYWIETQTILNANEVTVSKTIFLEDGSVRRKEEHEYNEYGDMIHVVNTRNNDEGELYIYSEQTYEYEYNADGTVAKSSAVAKSHNAPDSVYTDEYTYQDGYLYREYSSGTTLFSEYSNGATEDYSWWDETIYNEEGFPVSWGSDDMEEDEQEHYEGADLSEDLSGLVIYHSDGTIDILPEDGFIATCDEHDIVFVRIGSDEDIAGEPEEELDENGNVAARTYYCHSGEVNRRVEYTYITVKN